MHVLTVPVLFVRIVGDSASSCLNFNIVSYIKQNILIYFTFFFFPGSFLTRHRLEDNVKMTLSQVFECVDYICLALG